jgi:peptidyl-dipeptidase Dcp
MGWHGQDPTAITDVKALKPNNLQPQNYTRSSRKRNEYRISHIFQGGYSSGLH